MNHWVLITPLLFVRGFVVRRGTAVQRGEAWGCTWALWLVSATGAHTVPTNESYNVSEGGPGPCGIQQDSCYSDTAPLTVRRRATLGGDQKYHSPLTWAHDFKTNVKLIIFTSLEGHRDGAKYSML